MTNAALVPAALLRKVDLAEEFRCSVRQVELMTADGRLPKPFRLGDSSPRWRREDIDAWLARLAAEAQSGKSE